jgi:four helix bundle protein
LALTRFEDIVAWQRARELAREVYLVTISGPLARDFGLKDQMRRSSVSMMANIAEGFDRNRPKEFLRFLDIAQGSCAELRSHLYIAHDVGYLDEPTFERLRALAAEAARVTGGLQRSIERRTASEPNVEGGP